MPSQQRLYSLGQRGLFASSQMPLRKKPGLGKFEIRSGVHPGGLLYDIHGIKFLPFPRTDAAASRPHSFLEPLIPTFTFLANVSTGLGIVLGNPDLMYLGALVYQTRMDS